MNVIGWNYLLCSTQVLIPSSSSMYWIEVLVNEMPKSHGENMTNLCLILASPCVLNHGLVSSQYVSPLCEVQELVLHIPLVSEHGEGEEEFFKTANAEKVF